jgi:FAD/FMN-containing dehydrogenase
MTIRHIPADMTVTVGPDVTLPALQAELAQNGQWLPVDPPGTLTIRQLLDRNTSGPRRYGSGTIREHLLGLRVRLENGRVIKSGGQTVKNVAGYDLCRLFVGARGELGEILEATFKLHPMPEAERILQKKCATLADAARVIEAVLAAPVMPTVLDLIPPATVVVGFAGAREDVDWQTAQLTGWEAGNLDYNRELPGWTSVLPSKVTEAVAGMRDFIARAGNGVIYHEGPAETSVPLPELQRRVREALRGAN